MPYGEWNGAPRFPEMKGLEALFQEWMREQLIRSWPRLGRHRGHCHKAEHTRQVEGVRKNS